jgi:outer membrane receptor protein involved in Fe transport
MKTLLNLYFASAVLCFSSLAFSQGGIVTGAVIDANDKEGIEFTTLTLFNAADSSLAGGTVTDTAGHFYIDGLAGGTYYMRMSFIGYQTQFVQNIVLSAQTPYIDLGQLELSVSGELGAVDVVVNQAVFETKIDKKIFNADENLTSKGGTGLDLLRQVPTITVDENDNILLRGDGNVTILIDGRPSAMPANQLLKQLPASAIDRVEIITNPSAKYDPEGMSGIINVVLKKSKLSGFNGNFNTSVGQSKFTNCNSSIGLNYRNDKFNVYSSYSYYYGKSWFGGTLERDVLLSDSTWDRLRSDDYGDRINTYHSARVGVDFFANDKNTFYLSANADYGTNLGTRLVNYNNYGESDELLYYSQRNGQINAPSSNYVFTGGWQKTFGHPDHTLFVDFNFSNSSFEGDEWLWQKYYDTAGSNYATAYQHTLDKTYHQTLLGKIDYVWPINDSTILEAGFHFTQRLADNDFFSESAGDDAIYSNDTGLINHFNYVQNTFAPYVTFARQFRKLGAKIGVRAEPTLTTAQLVNTNETFDNNYFQLFPSAHLSYKTDNYSEFMLSYSRRINRPELDQLNPFTNYSDPLVLETGNPFLKPEIIHVNEFSYMKYWKKFNINATVYYRLITDLIRRSLSYEGTISHVTNTNLGNSSLTGGDLILTYSPIKGMRFVSSTSVWNTSTKDAEVTSGTMLHYVGMYSSLMASYRAPKGWSFQLWGSYSPTARVIQGYILENYGGGFAIQKSLFKDKGNINLSVYDVLKSRWFAFESYDLGNYNMTSIRRWQSRSAYLTFTYNFGKMTQGKERRENTSGGIGDDVDVPISN